MREAPEIPLPSSWPTVIKAGVLHAIGIAHLGMTQIRAVCADSRIAAVRLRGENDRLRAEINLLVEELRIKDVRLGRIVPRERPHYPPTERMAILQLKAARGWTLEQAAARFLVTAATLATWNRRADALDSTLVQLVQPVNRFPDLVAYVVQTLRLVAPSMGAVRIGQQLARAGLQLGVSTVRRLARRGPVQPEPLPQPRRVRTTAGPVYAKYVNHVWNVDLTTVATAGTTTPWFPFATPPSRPFTWWVAIVLDHFSRCVIGFAVFAKQPTAKELCKALDRAVDRIGVAPKYMLSDQGVQFRKRYRAWCKRRKVVPRFGAIGQHGSIAIVERFMRTMKDELWRRVLVPFAATEFRGVLARYVCWYNLIRPHRSLGGATPIEVYRAAPRPKLARFEPRARYPREKERIRGKPGTALRLIVRGFEGAEERLLPVVELRRAA